MGITANLRILQAHFLFGLAQYHSTCAISKQHSSVTLRPVQIEREALSTNHQSMTIMARLHQACRGF
ncbi:Uncharacterised protein [Vibrio cholerae]|nr:Uncharacterised protein [Vibrio cholerae]CSH99195.1 Uncharacterised protein [Vibrio cholerae]